MHGRHVQVLAKTIGLSVSVNGHMAVLYQAVAFAAILAASRALVVLTVVFFQELTRDASTSPTSDSLLLLHQALARVAHAMKEGGGWLQVWGSSTEPAGGSRWSSQILGEQGGSDAGLPAWWAETLQQARKLSAFSPLRADEDVNVMQELWATATMIE